MLNDKSSYFIQQISFVSKFLDLWVWQMGKKFCTYMDKQLFGEQGANFFSKKKL